MPMATRNEVRNGDTTRVAFPARSDAAWRGRTESTVAHVNPGWRTFQELSNEPIRKVEEPRPRPRKSTGGFESSLFMTIGMIVTICISVLVMTQVFGTSWFRTIASTPPPATSEIEIEPLPDWYDDRDTFPTEPDAN